MTSDTKPIRIVYFGTPDFAVPALRALSADSRFEVVLVVSQPDRPAGRGRRLTSPAVKVAADEMVLPTYQPSSLRQADARQPLIDADADLFIVAAFGMIFGPKTLAIPRRGCINLHASILPAYRGAAPISAAIATRDTESGVTMMLMDVGLDTGPVLDVVRLPILPDDTTASLTGRLADLGAESIGDVADDWVEGRVIASPQPDGASLTRPLVKPDGWLDWTLGTDELEARVRAMWPWPRAWTTAPDGTVVQIHEAVRSGFSSDTELVPGTVLMEEQRALVRTADGWLELRKVQAPGGRPGDASVLIRQGVISPGDVLGQTGEPVRTPLVRPA